MTARSNESLVLKGFLKYADFCGWLWESIYRLNRWVRGLPMPAICNECGKRITRSYPGFASKKGMTPVVQWSCPNNCSVENYPDDFCDAVRNIGDDIGEGLSEDFRGHHVLGKVEVREA